MKLIQEKIRNNSRLTFLKDLESAVELKAFIDYLDGLYNVDSSDPNNTFGMIDLETPILLHGVNNTIYFAKANGSGLPLHQKAPQKEKLSFSELVDFNFQHPVNISQEDFEKLIVLRRKFQQQILDNAPVYPNLATLELRLPDQKTFLAATTVEIQEARNDLLLEQGFASGKQAFHEYIRIKNLGTFEISYMSYEPQSAPKFGTSLETKDCCGQCQDLIPVGHVARDFYEKWRHFHLSAMTLAEYDEMIADLEIVKKIKNK